MSKKRVQKNNASAVDKTPSPVTQKAAIPGVQQLLKSHTLAWEETLNDGTHLAAFTYKGGFLMLKTHSAKTVMPVDMDFVLNPHADEERYWEIIMAAFDRHDANYAARHSEKRDWRDAQEHAEAFDTLTVSLEDVGDLEAQDAIDNNELKECILIVEKLLRDPNHMKMFIEHEFYGYTYREIGAHFGVSHKTARKHVEKTRWLLWLIYTFA